MAKRDRRQALELLVDEATDGQVCVDRAAELLGRAGRGAMLAFDEVARAWNLRHPSERLTVRCVRRTLCRAHAKLRHALRGCV